MTIIQDAMQRKSLEDIAEKEGRLEEHTDASRLNAVVKRSSYHLNLYNKHVQRKIRTLGAALLAISSFLGGAVLAGINEEKKIILLEDYSIEMPSIEIRINSPKIHVVPYITDRTKTPEYRLI